MGFKTPRPMTLSLDVQPKRGVLWLLLVALSIAPLFPVSNYVGHPHWDLIRWIPFQDFSFSRNMLKDVIGNILWFMMFGYLLRYQLNEGWPSLRALATTVAVAGGISLSVEFFQIFCHNRIPSMSDVMCNMFGASLGGYVAEKQRTAAATARTRYAMLNSDGSRRLP